VLLAEENMNFYFNLLKVISELLNSM